VKVARGIATPILPLMGGGSGGASAAESLLGSELSGFTLDFLTNTYAVRTISDGELLLLQLGNEWDGLALDFTTNLVASRVSLGAERLLGTGPDTVEPYCLGLDFTDNTSAVRN
jgi:hypothetical protein